MVTVLLVIVLTLLAVNTALITLGAIAIVRLRESNDEKLAGLQGNLNRLNQELLLRLPQRPYGVEYDSPSGNLMYDRPPNT